MRVPFISIILTTLAFIAGQSFSSEFPKALAYNACALSDGPAVHIDLGAAPNPTTAYPRIGIGLFNPMPLRIGTYRTDGATQDAAASFCPKANACESLFGSVTITKFLDQKWIEGRYELNSIQGKKWYKGEFHADWQKATTPIPCG
jgi:hypothetical protein